MSLRIYAWFIACPVGGAAPFATLVISIYASGGEKLSRGGIYAFTEMAGHVELVIEFFTNFGFGQLPLVWFEGCGCLFSRLRSRKVVAE